MKRKLWLLLALPPVVLGGLGALSWRKPPELPYESSLSWKASFPNEAAVAKIASDASEPYVVRATIGKGEITIVGAHHIRDPKDPSLAKIEEAWRQAKPTVAFVEGKPSGFLAAINPVGKFGEAGFVAGLARGAGVPTFTWHVPQHDMGEALLKSYAAKQVAMFMMGNKYFADLRFGKPSDPDSVMAELIRTKATDAVEDEVQSVADYDRIWKEDFPTAKDWRETSDQFGLPGYLEKIALSSRQIRDRHLLNLAIGRAREGERVFAICGMNHATRIEPMLAEIVRNGSWAASP